MTKLICANIDCQYLGENYVCKLNKVKMVCHCNRDKETLQCSNYKKDYKWQECVRAIQRKVDKGEVVI